MLLGESLEDYLETIVMLKEEYGKVRSIDIARKMEVSKPSVNKAMNVLKEKGYILQEPYGDVKLTEEGEKIAAEVFNRHQKIYSFLTNVLGVSAENAENDACKIEHVISEETFEKMCNFK